MKVIYLILLVVVYPSPTSEAMPNLLSEMIQSALETFINMPLQNQELMNSIFSAVIMVLKTSSEAIGLDPLILPAVNIHYDDAFANRNFTLSVRLQVTAFGHMHVEPYKKLKMQLESGLFSAGIYVRVPKLYVVCKYAITLVDYNLQRKVTLMLKDIIIGIRARIHITNLCFIEIKVHLKNPGTFEFTAPPVMNIPLVSDEANKFIANLTDRGYQIASVQAYSILNRSIKLLNKILNTIIHKVVPLAGACENL